MEKAREEKNIGLIFSILNSLFYRSLSSGKLLTINFFKLLLLFCTLRVEIKDELARRNEHKYWNRLSENINEITTNIVSKKISFTLFSSVLYFLSLHAYISVFSIFIPAFQSVFFLFLPLLLAFYFNIFFH